MSIFIISDDAFFLAGLQENIQWHAGGDVFLVNINEVVDGIHSAAGDIIVLAVDDLHARSKLMMQVPAIHQCRVVLMVSVPVRNITPEAGPWLVRKNVSPGEFFKLLSRARYVRRRTGTVRPEIRKVFHSLGHGLDIGEVAGIFHRSEKYLYQMRRNLVRRYGLADCNSAGILICRDILYAMPSAVQSSPLVRRPFFSRPLRYTEGF